MNEDDLKSKPQGVWIPQKLLNYFDQGDINSMELLLLVKIDSFRSNDLPCFAENEYLAKITHNTVRHTQRMLSKLENLGLLIKKNKNGRRLLLSKFPSGGDDESVTPGMTKTSSPHDRNVTPKQSILRAESEPLIDKYNNKALTVADATVRGFFNSSQKDQYDELAASLLSAVLRARKCEPSAKPTGWAKELRLLKLEPERITKVLNWYCTVIGQPFIPEAFSGRAFRLKFFNIESKMPEEISEITEKEKIAFERSEQYHLSIFSKEDNLEMFVQSRRNYVEFNSKAMLWLEACELRRGTDPFSSVDFKFKKKLCSFNEANLILNSIEPNNLLFVPAKYFMPEWLKFIHSRFSLWKEFKGTSKTLIWTPAQRDYDNLIKSKMVEMNIPVETWAKILERIK